MKKSELLLELEKTEEKYRIEYGRAYSAWKTSRANMIKQAMEEKWFYPISELKRYPGEMIEEIAVVFCNKNGSSRKVEILNSDSENHVSVTTKGFLQWIEIESWGFVGEAEYTEHIFSKDLGNGILTSFENEKCIIGFLWVKLTGETKRRGYGADSL